MPCYHPLQAFKTASGEVVFCERGKYDIVRSLSLPCGQCVGCRLERSRQWAMRCMHESSLHELNSFITLTYDDDHLPKRGCLEYPAFQLFLKRLRKAADPLKVRFFMCGEYGSETWRPHYHACLFGVDFADKKYWRTSDSGSRCFRSALLERLWPYGNSEVGSLTFESAAYVARYCVAKRTGPDAELYYRRVDAEGVYQLTPEFGHMSLKPGIGQEWYRRFGAGVYEFDSVIVRGREVKPPKYYDVLFGRDDPEGLESLKFEREATARLRYEDNTDARLAVKEIVARSRANFLHRS